MTNVTVHHPTLDQLQDFIRGKILDRELTRFIEQHIESCNECCQKLEKISADTFEELACGSPTEFLLKTSHRTQSVELPEELLRKIEEGGRYEIDCVIGWGATSVVYSAKHRLLERKVALKIICPQTSFNVSNFERFERELRAVGSLSHPNIVSVYDAEIVDDYLLLSMELIEGESLAELVQKKGPLAPQTACDYIVKIAEGLKHAHDRNIIHRDIKPSNVMLGVDGSIKILDFGLAQSIQVDDGSELRPGLFLGTPSFMAPEQFDNPHKVDARSDIYSLGCTFYYLLVGRSPNSWNPWAVLQSRPSILPSGFTKARIPTYLVIIMQTMLEKSPAERFESVDRFLEVLQSYYNDKFVGIPRAATTVNVPQRTNVRRTWSIFPLIILIVVISLIAFIIFYGTRP